MFLLGFPSQKDDEDDDMGNEKRGYYHCRDEESSAKGPDFGVAQTLRHGVDEIKGL